MPRLRVCIALSRAKTLFAASLCCSTTFPLKYVAAESSRPLDHARSNGASFSYFSTSDCSGSEDTDLGFSLDAHADDVDESVSVRRFGADFTDFLFVDQKNRSRSPTRREDLDLMMINKAARFVECNMCGDPSDLHVMACLDWHLPLVCPLLLSPGIIHVYNSFFLVLQSLFRRASRAAGFVF
jgi:hypothetical protein